VAALYFNYLDVTSQVITVLVFGSLAITVVSAFDYAMKVFQPGSSA
jgi:hypothetical protein